MNGPRLTNPSLAFKHQQKRSDRRLMARRFTVGWWTGVLVLAVLGWHVATGVPCFAGKPAPVFQSLQSVVLPPLILDSPP